MQQTVLIGLNSRSSDVQTRQRKKAIGNRRRMVNEISLFNSRSVYTHETKLSSLEVDDDIYYDVQTVILILSVDLF